MNNPPSEREITAFVQKNADYYIRKWRTMIVEDSKLSWNWASFIFSTTWLVYRKMYKEALLLQALAFVLSAINFAFFYPSPDAVSLSPMQVAISGTLSFLIPAITGAFGNYLYLRKFTQIREELLKQNLQEDTYIEILRTKGGVTWLLAILFAVLAYIIGSAIFIATVPGGEEAWMVE